MSGTFRENRIADLPKFLRGPQAEAYAGALGAAQDAELAGLKFAVKQRFPTTCEADALDKVGAGYVIERFDGEPLETYRRRLLVAWPTWNAAGTAPSIIDSLNAFGVPEVYVYESREKGHPA